jgi:serine protease inhibitor
MQRMRRRELFTKLGLAGVGLWLTSNIGCGSSDTNTSSNNPNNNFNNGNNFGNGNNGNNPDPINPNATPEPGTRGKIDLKAIADEGAKAQTAVNAQNAFGLALLQSLAGNGAGKNVFISPTSLFLALMLAENGANGATQLGFHKALQFPKALVEKGTAAETEVAVNTAAASLQKILQMQPGVELSIANALWGDDKFAFKPAYQEACKTHYNADATTLDFQKATAADTINKWANNNTKGKIPKIVDAEFVAQMTVILTNAVYFKATWAQKFDKKLTRNQPFHPASGPAKPVPMMHNPGVGEYLTGKKYTGVRLAYENASFAMVAILPADGTTPEALIGTWTPDDWAELVVPKNNIREEKVDLSLPRFTLNYDASLKDALAALGLTAAFSDGADLTRMGTPENLVLSEVKHFTRLEVDESGTVAAAATVIGGNTTSVPLPNPKLTFDRPFVLLLQDTVTGTVLFCGVVQDI